MSGVSLWWSGMCGGAALATALAIGRDGPAPGWGTVGIFALAGCCAWLAGRR